MRPDRGRTVVQWMGCRDRASGYGVICDSDMRAHRPFTGAVTRIKTWPRQPTMAPSPRHWWTQRRVLFVAVVLTWADQPNAPMEEQDMAEAPTPPPEQPPAPPPPPPAASSAEQSGAFAPAASSTSRSAPAAQSSRKRKQPMHWSAVAEGESFSIGLGCNGGIAEEEL